MSDSAFLCTRAALWVAVLAVVALLVYFPHSSPAVARLMRWWWFRLACLALLLCAAAWSCDGHTVAHAPVSRMLVLLLGVLYVCSANVPHVRRAATAE